MNSSVYLNIYLPFSLSVERIISPYTQVHSSLSLFIWLNSLSIFIYCLSYSLLVCLSRYLSTISFTTHLPTCFLVCALETGHDLFPGSQVRRGNWPRGQHSLLFLSSLAPSVWCSREGGCGSERREGGGRGTRERGKKIGREGRHRQRERDTLTHHIQNLGILTDETL